MANGNPEERILILAPIGQDATAMARLLHTHGFVGTVCESAADACRYLTEGAGALAEELALWANSQGGKDNVTVILVRLEA